MFCGHGYMLHADLCAGLTLCTNENADVQIWSSRGPYIGLVEGTHEDINAGTHYEIVIFTFQCIIRGAVQMSVIAIGFP